MGIAIETLGPGALELTIQGKLEKDDYDRLVPVVEEQVAAHGKIGLLIDVTRFGGWSLAALWEDLKFDVRHYRDVSRLALVGDGASKKWMATVSKPFTAARVEYFPDRDIEAARRWVREAPAA